MNHIYKTKYNEALRTWVAVPEIAKGRGKSSKTMTGDNLLHRPKLLLSALTVALLQALSGQVFAAPLTFSTTPAAPVTDVACNLDTKTHRMVCNEGATVSDGSENSMAVGNGAKIGANPNAPIENSIAIGNKAEVRKLRGVAVPAVMGTNNYSSIAIGTEAKATDDRSVAIGYKAKTGETAGISLGAWSATTGSGAIAIGTDYDGNHSTVAAQDAISLGYWTKAGQNSVVLGTRYKDVGNDNLILGTGNSGTSQSTITGTKNVVVGNYNTITSGNNITILGSNIEGNVSNATYIGSNSVAYKNKSPHTAGTGAYSRYDQNGFDIGDFAGASPVAVVTFGSKGAERRLQNVAAGLISAESTDAINGSQLFHAMATLKNNSTIPKPKESLHFYSVDGGKSQDNYDNHGAKGTNALAAGTNTVAQGAHATAVGDNAHAISENTVAFGHSAYATGLGSIAIGAGNNFDESASTYADYAIALGTGSSVKAKGEKSLAFGYGAIATHANSVALGDGSATGAAHTGNYTYQGLNDLSVAGTSAYGVVSVGDGTNYRQIQKVAAGLVAEDSTDAINGSQLFALANAVPVVFTDEDGNPVKKAKDGKWYAPSDIGADGMPNPGVAAKTVVASVKNPDGTTATATKLRNVAPGTIAKDSTDAVNGSQIKAISDGNKTIFGGDAAVDSNGVVTMSNVGGTGENNINDAIKSVNATAKKHNTVIAGDNIEVSEKANANGGIEYEVATAKKVTFEEVTADDGKGNSAVLTKSGTTVKDDAGNKSTYGAAGSTVKDKAGNQAVYDAGGVMITPTGGAAPVSLTSGGLNNGGNKITNIAAGTAPTDAVNVSQLSGVAGSLGAQIANVSTHVTQVDNHVTNINGAVGGGGYLSATGTLTAKGREAIKTYNVEGNHTYQNRSVIEAIKNINEQGIRFFHTNDGQRVIEDGVAPEDSSAAGIFSVAIGYQASVGHNGDNSVAIGKGARVSGKNSIAIGTGHVVNGNNAGAFGDPNVVNGNNSYAIGNNNVINADNTFVLGNEVQADAGHDGAVVLGDKSTVDKVHQGPLSWDGHAVAGKRGAGTRVVSVGSKGNERQIQNVAPGVISATSTDAVNGSQLHTIANEIDQRASAGIASAMATAGLPQAYLPGKSMVSAAAGHYRGENAIAVGVSTISDNGKWIIKGTANANGDDFGVTVGAGYQW